MGNEFTKKIYRHFNFIIVGEDMINNKRVLAIIPARGGSKGIPYKNIIEVEGKPLIQYTIDAAKNSRYIDEIYVSTDDVKIKRVVESLDMKINRLRPGYLATDESKTIDVVIDTIEYFESIGERFDYIILLQPTQPLRQTFHIDDSLEIMEKEDYKSLVSVHEVNENPILMRTIDEKGKLKRILQENSTVRRQNFKSYYFVNGAIYINKVDENLNIKTSLNDNSFAYIMNREYCVDIDDEQDIELFIQELKRKKEKK